MPTDDRQSKVRVGICGFGASASYFHLPLIRNEPAVHLMAAFDPTPERRRLAEQEGFEITLPPEELKAAIKEIPLDLIIVTSPNSFHFHQAHTALESGAHVLVDKPVALKIDDVRTLIRLSGAKNLVLMAFHNRQYDDDHLQAVKLLEAHQLGRITRIDMAVAGWGPFNTHAAPEFNPRWRVDRQYGGGCLHDWGPHVLEQLLRFTGWELPRRIFASARSSVWSADCDDIFTAIYDWEDFSARVLISTLDHAPVERLRICGTKGTVVTRGDDNVGEVTLYSPGGLETRPYSTPRLAASALYNDLIAAIVGGSRENVAVRLWQTEKLYTLMEKTLLSIESLS